MAILSKIRQRTVFLIFIIALALFSFVLMDMLNSGTFSSQRAANSVGTINGVDISKEEFSNQVDNVKQQMGGDISDMQAVNFVWNRMVNSTVLESQVENLNITVPLPKKVDALSQFFAQDSRFLNEYGMFDYDKYLDFMKDAKKNNPTEYYRFSRLERQVEVNLMQEMYLTMINAGINASNADGEFEYKSQNDRVNFSFVQIPYASIPDESITISEEEIINYMKKNPLKYQSEATADIQYVFFSGDPSSEDEEAVKAEVATLMEDQLLYNAATRENDTIPGLARTTDYEEFLSQYSDIPYNDQFVFKYQLPEGISDSIFSKKVGEIYGPFKFLNNYGIAKVVDTKEMHDSIHVKHILVSWKDFQTNVDFRTKEASKALADSLLAVIKSDKSKFEELAKDFSNDPSATSNGGDLGYIQPYNDFKAFDDFIIEKNAGTIDVVETEIGYRIISIEDKKNSQKAIKTAIVLRAIQPSQTTNDLVFNQATSFESGASIDFVQAAAENNYEVRPVNGIKQFDDNIPGIGSNRELVAWAFNNKTKVGDIKRVSVGDSYVVAQVTSKREKGLMAAYEASPLVSPIIRNEKKAQMIRKGITGTTLEEIAAANNTSVGPAIGVTMASPSIVGVGLEPKVVGVAMALKEGETSQLIDGAFGVYKITVDKKEEASDMADYSTYSVQVKSKLANNVSTRVLEALKTQAKIEDRRGNFYQ